MNKRDKIAFAIYFIGCLMLIGAGVAYLSCSTLMPYHKEAINMPWEQLSTEMQVLFQAAIKISAAGFFVTGFSALIILLIPFRQGEKWAHWAIPLLGLIWNIATFYVTVTIAIKTNASTPWPAAILGIVMIVSAFILSPGFGKNYRKKGST